MIGLDDLCHTPVINNDDGACVSWNVLETGFCFFSPLGSFFFFFLFFLFYETGSHSGALPGPELSM